MGSLILWWQQVDRSKEIESTNGGCTHPMGLAWRRALCSVVWPLLCNKLWRFCFSFLSFLDLCLSAILKFKRIHICWHLIGISVLELMAMSVSDFSLLRNMFTQFHLSIFFILLIFYLFSCFGFWLTLEILWCWWFFIFFSIFCGFFLNIIHPTQTKIHGLPLYICFTGLKFNIFEEK